MGIDQMDDRIEWVLCFGCGPGPRLGNATHMSHAHQ